MLDANSHYFAGQPATATNRSNWMLRFTQYDNACASLSLSIVGSGVAFPIEPKTEELL